jgi:hypothetical protein
MDVPWPAAPTAENYMANGRSITMLSHAARRRGAAGTQLRRGADARSGDGPAPLARYAQSGFAERWSEHRFAAGAVPDRRRSNQVRFEFEQ